MRKTYLLFCIFYFGLLSCNKNNEKISKNPYPGTAETLIQSLFEKVVVQKSFAIDSAEKYFSSLDSLTTLKKDYQAKKELIKGSIYLKKQAFNFLYLTTKMHCNLWIHPACWQIMPYREWEQPIKV